MAASSTSLNTQFSAASSGEARSVGEVIEADEVPWELSAGAQVDPSPRTLLRASGSEAGWDEEEQSTKSLRDSVFNYITENGRTYHSFQAGSYVLPNDAAENERLDVAFFVFKVVMGQQNVFSPVREPKEILDIGTGTGLWCIEVAREFPNAKITGTDLSPIQKERYPGNVKFIIDDANEEDWMIPLNTIDLIHTRCLFGCFSDFRDVLRKSFRCLKPGGWMECHELYTTIYCDDGTMPETWEFARWARRQDEASMALGKPLRIANKLKKWMEQAGYVDVHEEVFKVPINSWPKDPQLKLIGRFHERNIMDGLQAFSLGFLHRGLGWTRADIEVYLVNVRNALKDLSVHAYQKLYVVYGRKPDHVVSQPTPEEIRRTRASHGPQPSPDPGFSTRKFQV